MKKNKSLAQARHPPRGLHKVVADCVRAGASFTDELEDANMHDDLSWRLERSHIALVVSLTWVLSAIHTATS